MAPITILKEFFEARRRKLTLQRYTHLKTRAGEERLKLELVMPLLNEQLQGIPTPIQEAFEAMAKDKSAIKRSNLNIEYKGMTVEFFSNDTAREPWTNGREDSKGNASASGTMLVKFALVANGEGEKRTLDLQFVAYMPATDALLDWARIHLHGAFFSEANYSQSEMEFTPETEADPEPAEEAEDEEPEEKAAAELETVPGELTAQENW